MHQAVEVIGIIFVMLGGGLGIMLMLLVALILISLILDRLRALKAAIRKNRIVCKVVREVKRRWLGFKKNDPLLRYPNQAHHLNSSFFDKIGIYQRDVDWGD